MSTLKDIPVRYEAQQAPARSNPLANVFDEFMNFCRSRSLFMLHYCTG